MVVAASPNAVAAAGTNAVATVDASVRAAATKLAATAATSASATAAVAAESALIAQTGKDTQSTDRSIFREFIARGVGNGMFNSNVNDRFHVHQSRRSFR
jgi:hypothetical protein